MTSRRQPPRTEQRAKQARRQVVQRKVGEKPPSVSPEALLPGQVRRPVPLPPDRLLPGTASHRRPHPGSRPAPIELRSTRGCQIGDHNLQTNRFVVSKPNAEVTFDRALGRPRVVAAIRRLVRDPADRRCRDALVTALSATGWSVTAPPRLEVGPDESLLGLLRHLFALDVAGVQIGDHNTQRNTFRYVVGEIPTGTDLLRGNTELARALVDVLFPAGGSGARPADLANRLAAELATLDVAWADGRDHGLRYPWPSGHALLISRADGVTVGAHNEQRNDLEIQLGEVRVAEVRRGEVRLGEVRRAGSAPAAGLWWFVACLGPKQDLADWERIWLYRYPR